MSKTKDDSTDEHRLANQTSTDSDGDHTIDHYRCPHCSADSYTSTKEREVRIHLELASDGDHGARRGFCPVTYVEAADERGKVVEKPDGRGVKRDPDEFSEICEPDDDLSTAERRIVATKMMHLDYTAKEVVAFLDERGEAPSKPHVHQTLRDYFGTTDTVRGTRSYEELSERQQAAIDAAARYELGEFETQVEAANSIDEQAHYVRRYSYNYENVVERRTDALDGDVEEDAGSQEGETDTVRRENETGTYVGPSGGIDGTMQYITERPANGDVEDEDGFRTGESSQPDADSELAAMRGRIDTLRRLVLNDELDSEAAFDEIEQIFADAVVA